MHTINRPSLKELLNNVLQVKVKLFYKKISKMQEGTVNKEIGKHVNLSKY